jgi:glycosyltransferase involved in cell wall biosynthesis
VRQDWQVKNPPSGEIRIMRIIARMNVGGPAVQVSGLMRGLNNVDFDHRLYTGFCSADEADYLDVVATDVKAVRIEGFGRRVSLGGDIKAFVTMVKEIRSFKPHLIHTHTAKAGFLGRIASVVSLHPSIRVHTFHGHLLNGYFGPFKRLMVVISERFLGMSSHQLLAVGAKVRKDLLQAGVGKSEKFGLMPPGLEIDALPDKNLSRESLGLAQDQLQCAFIGRITRIKRPDRFLDVVAEIKSRRVDLSFFIAGDGELLEDCRARIITEELPVTVLGWQSDIEKILAASDIVVLTSDNEGTPLSLIQAGMAGLPVVTTNVGSVTDVVLDGTTGITTNFDVNQIADALEMLANNAGLRTAMGEAAKEFTSVKFGLMRLVCDHEELYKKLLTDRAKS